MPARRVIPDMEHDSHIPIQRILTYISFVTSTNSTSPPSTRRCGRMVSRAASTLSLRSCLFAVAIIYCWIWGKSRKNKLLSWHDLNVWRQKSTLNITDAPPAHFFPALAWVIFMHRDGYWFEGKNKSAWLWYSKARHFFILGFQKIITLKGNYLHWLVPASWFLFSFFHFFNDNAGRPCGDLEFCTTVKLVFFFGTFYTIGTFIQQLLFAVAFG